MKDSQIITRYTPTPSGYLHIGNICNFVYTWMMAKKHDAQILLRIDDLDAVRTKEEYLIDIFEMTTSTPTSTFPP